MKIRERNFGRTNEPEVILDVVIDIVDELRQLTRSPHTRFSDYEGRVDLGIAMDAGMKVQHPLDERML